MKKKNLVILTTLLTLFASVNSISANVNTNVKTLPTTVTSSAVTVNENQEEMILETINNFYAAKFSGYQEENHIETLSYPETYEYLSEKIKPFVTEKNYSIEFFLYDLVILNERINISNARIENFKYEINIKDLTIEENHATCILTETLSYDDVGTITVQSRLMDEYTLSLLYTEEGWKIYYIFSSSSERFYPNYDKFRSIEDMKADVEIGLQIDRKEAENFIPKPLEDESDSEIAPHETDYIRPYDRNAAADYATKYCDTGKYNPNFSSYSSDCQNFASQCIWAGFQGQATNSASIKAKALPMISARGTLWNRSVSTWTSASNFYKYIKNNTGYGIHGSITTDLTQAKVGDIIQYAKNVNKPYDTDHSYIVTRVTNPNSLNDSYNIFVSAHTTDRKDTRLSSIYTNTYAYSLIKINNLYYSDTGFGDWIKDDTGWWYRYLDGTYTTNNWDYINEEWYYFDSVGYMVTGRYKIDGVWYEFDSDGHWIG